MNIWETMSGTFQSFIRGTGLASNPAVTGGIALQYAKDLFDYTKSGKNLKRNNKGDKVKELQEVLNALGYNLTPDGKFGRNTFHAVYDYQQKRGLKPTGIFDKQTAYVMYTEISRMTEAGQNLLKTTQTYASTVINRAIPPEFRTPAQPYTTIQPKSKFDWKPYAIGGGILLAVLLLSKKGK